MYERLSLHNFTAFAETTFDFVKGVNAYAGVNGSGKTHVLKVLYALQKHQALAGDPTSREPLDVTLMSVFKPDSLGRLVRRARGVQTCSVEAVWNKRRLDCQFHSKTQTMDVGRVWELKQSPVLIPAKDILGHSVNFADAYDSTNAEGQRWLDFDVTYRDLLTHANPNVPRGRVPAAQQALLDTLRQQMTGTVSVSKTGRYYLQDAAGKIEFPLVAEGWRKLGLLWVLIRNGSLTSGSVLYWDEPEANLNPQMFPVVAEILVRLSSSGTQVHVATHSYAFLRELEFARPKKLRYFALDRTSEGVVARPCERFVDLEPNPILAEYERIYRKSVEQALG
ncbi:MAG: AAA family ATPase [Candidatus Eremiobacterota bacterium]